MPDLNFEIESVAPRPYSAAPLLNFKLRVVNATREPAHTVILRCQIMLDVTRRRYNAEEQERLLDLFGDPEQWDRTLRNMLWTNTTLVVPAFTGATVVDLQVQCTFDFNVAATKYFAGLEEGEVPLLLLFSGTIFYEAESGALQVTQIPWEKEARYRLPVRMWREMMDMYYPNSAWLCLRRDVFDRLYRYKVRRGIPTFEQALERVIPDVSAEMMEPGLEDPTSKETIH
ncbi:MAG TPA: DUF6084 family protein [Blastocatellia bacterium]|nr:DUF6084 family protein [Blastocatellia bacterium]